MQRAPPSSRRKVGGGGRQARRPTKTAQARFGSSFSRVKRRILVASRADHNVETYFTSAAKSLSDRSFPPGMRRVASVSVAALPSCRYGAVANTPRSVGVSKSHAVRAWPSTSVAGRSGCRPLAQVATLCRSTGPARSSVGLPFPLSVK